MPQNEENWNWKTIATFNREGTTDEKERESGRRYKSHRKINLASDQTTVVLGRADEEETRKVKYGTTKKIDAYGKKSVGPCKADSRWGLQTGERR